ncbi:MAG: ArnT family glycosyltransferase [Syntrophothermus sp.]
MFSRADRLILLLSVAAIFSSYYVCDRFYEQLPHTEDEISYRWQARVFAEGKLFVASPPHAKDMFIPFVIDHQGKRFSKYTPGWPLVLSLGMRIGLDSWVNPLLGGISVWLTYLLGKRLVSLPAGFIAALLMATSPFFLLNSGTYLSSNLSLMLTGIIALAWVESFSHPASDRYPIVAGLCLGYLALTRPLTAVGVALPFGIHELILAWRNELNSRRRMLVVVSLAVSLAGFLLLWQYLTTGSPFLNPYTLWWSFDRIGFGKGYGPTPGGYTLKEAQENMKVMLRAARRDAFGWGRLSWIFIPFGLWSFRKNKPAWSVLAIFFSLVLAYAFYFGTVTRYGPRYYYEGLYSLTILSAAGIVWLAGRNRLRIALAVLLTGGLIGYNLFFYLPARFDKARAIYGITRAQLSPFQTAEALQRTPALVLVALNEKNVYGNLDEDWSRYGGLLELQNPDLTSPFIFAVMRGEAENEALIRDYPNRRVIYYYPDEPGKFYESPRSE